MGALEQDNGGYAVVATRPDAVMMRTCFEQGMEPVKALFREDGDSINLRMKASQRQLVPSAPFSPVPAALWDASRTSWTTLCQGRWLYADRTRRRQSHAETTAHTGAKAERS